MRFKLWTLLAVTTAAGMLLQLSRQIPEVWRDPFALIAGAALLTLGAFGGSIVSHTASTQRAIRLIAFFFFIVLGIQWARSFRDDYLIWSFRWMTLGLLLGTFFPMNAARTESRSESVESSSAEQHELDEETESPAGQPDESVRHDP